MNPVPSDKRQPGFTLVELLVSLGIFLLVIGAAFTLLGSSQNRYQAESQVLTSFQEARLGLDQIVRDVNDAGYPPPSYVSTNFNLFTITPEEGDRVVWVLTPLFERLEGERRALLGATIADLRED